MSETTSAPQEEYKLYALDATYDNVLLAMQEKYYRITAEYILIYTAGDAPLNSVELQESDAVRLNDSEKQWIFGINVALLQEKISQETPSIVRRLNELLKAIEERVVVEDGEQSGGEAGTP